MLLFFFVMSTVPTEVDTYCNTPSLGDALPLVADRARLDRSRRQPRDRRADLLADMGVAARIGRDVAGGGAARARLRCGRRGAGGAARGRGDARSPHLVDEHDRNRPDGAPRDAGGPPRRPPPRPPPGTPP